uniref:Proline dehydrogenase n=1 Tax=Tetraselmis sp. GSL018 TaxID=582737 RepID=A0A061SK57_9CHLO
MSFAVHVFRNARGSLSARLRGVISTQYSNTELPYLSNFRATSTLQSTRQDDKHPVTELWPRAVVKQVPYVEPKTPEVDGKKPPLKLRDALVAYKSRSVAELLRAVTVFQTCKFRWLVKNAEPVLAAANSVSKTLTNFAVKKTFFAQFCAGETEDEVKPVMQGLYNNRVGSILDYAAEADLSSVPNPGVHGNAYLQKTEDHCNLNLNKYLQAISLATHVTKGAGVVAMKVTSLGNPFLLERMSAVPRDELTAEERSLVERLEERMNLLGQCAQNAGVRLLVDAEQSYFQPAIDELALMMMKNWNKEESVVFNTYQCYLKDAYGKLAAHLEASDREGFSLGAKLVRGAYMKMERQRAAERGYPSPIHDTIEDTHECFDSSVSLMLEQVKRQRGQVVIASHNENSILRAMEEMERLGISSQNPGVMFGQLQGMCDYLTYSLGARGYHAYKYLPYGPLNEVMPYLIRRAQENGDVLATTDMEKYLMLAEVKRRMHAALYPSHKAIAAA